MISLLGAGVGMVLAGLGWFSYLVMRPGGSSLGGLLDRHLARIENELRFLAFPLPGSTLLRAQVAVIGFLAFASVVLRQPVLLLFVGASIVGPSYVLRRGRHARVTRLEQQLDTWLLLVSNSLRSTPSVGDAIASTAALAPKDFGREIDIVAKELRLGVSVDRALSALAQRAGSSVISSAVTSICVARRTGGDLPTTLEETAASLRESARLEGVLRTKTAEGRGQVIVLAASPFVLCALIGWIEPTWFDATAEQPEGKLLLAACALLWLVATVWAQRITAVTL